MTPRTRLAVLLVSAPVIAFVIIGGLLGRVMARQDSYSHLKVFQDVLGLVTTNYVEPVNSEKLMAGAMRGLAEGLDPDSAYLTSEQVRQYQKGDQPAGDVGIELTRNYYLRVIAARDNSPAARAGLLPGDFVRAIDGRPTREMSVPEGARLLRGAPGSTLALTVIRSNAAEPHTIELVREVLPEPQTTGRIAKAGVGYLRIPVFTPATAQQIGARVAELKREGATKLAIDLRASAGGPLDTGLAAARLFVPSGTLAVFEKRDGPKEPVTAAPGDGAITMPVAILVDMGTSGPAELFAAALSGNKRADLVGERTHGRVAVQKLVTLPDGSGMLIPSAWYLGPSGSRIHDKGLSPDVDVDVPDVELGASRPATDLVLEKALEHLARATG